jgi:uncharacterized membrane protein YfcA
MNFIVGIVAFVSEYLDSGLGMGYGTALAPLLIIFGYSPAQVVPAILFSQLITDVATCFLHHRCANVNLRIMSEDFKIAGALGVLSSLGAALAVTVAVKIPRQYLVLYIGFLVTAMGILILIHRRPARFSWSKIMGISFLAAFNKGISGGGYGPLVMGGQILSGVNAKNAVGITAFAEALTCFTGFVFYLVLGKTVDWTLVILLSACAVPAVPFAVLTVKKVDSHRLKFFTGILITLLGLCTLLRISAGS